MAVKKKVLGRGLGALIGEAAGAAGVARAAGAAVTAGAAGKYMLCPIGSISPNKSQPRKVFEKAALSELADSIKENGIIEPLVVRPDGPGYELIAGERRLRAAAIARLEQVPVVIMDVTDLGSLELAIVENIQRENLNAIEEAEAYRSLMGFGFSQAEVADKVGKDRVTVANYLRLLKLPAEVKDEIASGAISMGHARAILSVDGHAAQNALCARVIKKGLSVRQTEQLAAEAGQASARKGGARRGSSSSHVPSLEAELREVFGTKVSVKEKKGRGSVVIEFYSREERERVLELLRKIG